MKNKILLFLFLIGIAVSLSAQRQAVIINKTGFDIYHLFISSTDSEDWGKDQIPFDVILNGDYKILDLDDGASSYDFRFVDEDDDTYYKYEISISERKKVVVTIDDLSYINQNSLFTEEGWSINLGNSTGNTILAIYISPTNSTSWGPNLIESELFYQGNSISITMTGLEEGALFDIRLDSSSGESFIREQVQLTEHIRLSITSDDRQ